MNTPLPEHAVDLNDWSQLKPAFDELTAAPLSGATCEAWLADWTRVAYLVYEAFARANVATTINTEDADAKKRLFHFLENICPGPGRRSGAEGKAPGQRSRARRF
ncbi:MAG: hypothetical protein IPO29_12430 [Anaerolineae bacterium]|nr:hypothetical protein [Anaerolineae bacterium]